MSLQTNKILANFDTAAKGLFGIPGSNYNANDFSRYVQQISDHVDQFSNLFKNSVGRDATDEEKNKFLTDYITPNAQHLSDPNYAQGNQVRNDIGQYIGDTFQQTAQDVATQKTKDLEGQYGSLADQYLAMGQKSLGNLSDDLKTFSTSLFEKLRPQLNLAAQAGGYADSGGQTLQEQGALKDLATQAQGTLAGAKYDVESNANNIRLGGQAAPLSLASSFAANTPYAVENLGTGALNYNNTNSLANSRYLQQLGLMDAQGRLTERTIENTNPSFGRTLSQNFAKSFGESSGNQATQYGKQFLSSLSGNFGSPGKP